MVGVAVVKSHISMNTRVIGNEEYNVLLQQKDCLDEDELQYLERQFPSDTKDLTEYFHDVLPMERECLKRIPSMKGEYKFPCLADHVKLIGLCDLSYPRNLDIGSSKQRRVFMDSHVQELEDALRQLKQIQVDIERCIADEDLNLIEYTMEEILRTSEWTGGIISSHSDEASTNT